MLSLYIAFNPTTMDCFSNRISHFLFYIVSFSYFLFIPLSIISPRSNIFIFSLLLFLFFLAYIKKIGSIKKNILNSFLSNKPIILSTFFLLLLITVSSIKDLPIIEPLSILTKIISLSLLGCFFYQSLNFFTNNEKQQFLKSALFGCAIGGVILLGDSFLQGKLAQLKGCDSPKVYAKIMLITSFISPFGLFFIKNHILKVVWIFFFTTVFYFGQCDTAFLAFTVSVIFYYLFCFHRIKKFFYFITPISIIIFMLFLPTLMQKTLPFYKGENNIISKEFSYKHRIDIWHTIANKIEEQKLFGYGINAAKRDNVSGGEKEISHDFGDEAIKINYRIHHPHNYILQLWLELGFIGILFSILLIISLLYKLQYSRELSTSGFLIFSCAQIHLLFSISLWQTWWWITLIFIFPLLTSVNNNE